MEVPEIILPQRSRSSTPALTPVHEDGGGLCALCFSAPGKYTCPRCNSPYCSLACYRGPRHTACSELFYRESVLEELRAEGPRDRRQMEETLLRLREQEEAAAGEPAEETELWESLTARERDDFTRLLRSGGIGALVPRWRPWWHPEDRRQVKIQEVPPKEEADEDLSADTGVPPVLRAIPPLRSLCRHPSPLVRYSLVSALYGYAFSLLRHNGDLSDEDILLDFTGTLLAVSGALSTSAVYQSSALALKSALRVACDPQIGGDDHLASSAMEATSHILQGDDSKRYALAALSHLTHILGRVRRHTSEDKEIRKAAFHAKKKCLFLAAWVNENEACLPGLSTEVMAERRQYVDEIGAVAEISKGLQKVWGAKRPPEKKKLVQEIDPAETIH